MQRKYVYTLRVGLLLVFGIGLLFSTEPKTRMVRGTVVDETTEPVKDAVVQLKSRQLFQIRSYITQEDGTYFFRGLQPNFDYEIQARFGDRTSRIVRLSRFDSQEERVVDLRLRPERK